MRFSVQRLQFLAGLMIGLALACSSQAQTKIDGTAETFSGSVKSVRMESAEVDYRANKEGKRRKASNLSFNEFGQETEEITYTTQGGLQSTKETIYDPQGKTIQIVSYNAKRSPTSKTIYYFENGRKSKMEKYNEKNVLTEKTDYVYDSENRLIEEVTYEDNSLHDKSTYKYDSAGKLVEIQTTDTDGGVGKTVYSADGKRKQRSYFKAKDSPDNRLIVRVEKDKQTDLTYYRADGAIVGRWMYNYDDKGNVIAEEFGTTAVLRKWVYAYEYDQQGNWTKRTASQLFLVSGKLTPFLQEASYRTFTYYPEPYKAQQNNLVEEKATGGVLAGRALVRVEPEYPQAAKNGRVSGTVITEIIVNEIGDVTTTKVISGPSMLHDASVEAVKKWKFKPTFLNGMPVKVIGTVTFNFNI